jgi:hypothetical protein
MRLAAAGFVGSAAAQWFEQLAAFGAESPKRHRSCILLWMNGGPSQMDTFDLKPNTTHGGPFQEIATSVPGIRISEHLPRIAKQVHNLSIVRSMSTKEGDHSRATQFVHTGYPIQGPIAYPTLGSLISKELNRPDSELPGFVSIAPYRALSPAAYSSGFLGPRFAPLLVADDNGLTPEQAAGGAYREAGLQVKNLHPPDDVSTATMTNRLDLLRDFDGRFSATHVDPVVASHVAAYQRATRLMNSEAAAAFDLSQETAPVRDAYGRNRFGQGCLLARRLVERGVPFVEVTLGGVDSQLVGWDTHVDNFTGVRRLSQVLDPAWSTLMTDLEDRGLLESTLIVWLGEFGRTPQINANGGRDHYPQAWSAVLGGGGIRGGQVIGRTSRDGTTIEDRPVTLPDLLATICLALGIDPIDQNDSNVGRPIRIVDPEAQPIDDIVA